MPPTIDRHSSILSAWRTSNRVTIELIAQVPPALWKASVPGAPNRTIRMLAAHLHNSRCGWIRTLGSERGIAVPARVDRWTATRREVVAALKRSSLGMEALLELGVAAGGVLPASKRYVWRNLALDVGHVLTYFVAHEAHHRGQLVMVARQLDRALPRAALDGLWWWSPRKPKAGRVSARRPPFSGRRKGPQA